MSSLIAPSDLKEHTNTLLSDSALQRIIDSEEMDIIDRYGEHVSVVEEFEKTGFSNEIFPSRKVGSISEISESLIYDWYDNIANPITTVLASDDYELVAANKCIRRINSGTNPRLLWGDRVKITYVPYDGTAKRIMALINLCKINLQFNGLTQESLGYREYVATKEEYDKSREKIFLTLESGTRTFA